MGASAQQPKVGFQRYRQNCLYVEWVRWTG
jgi:hypothetical protein